MCEGRFFKVSSTPKNPNADYADTEARKDLIQEKCKASDRLNRWLNVTWIPNGPKYDFIFILQDTNLLKHLITAFGSTLVLCTGQKTQHIAAGSSSIGTFTKPTADIALCVCPLCVSMQNIFHSAFWQTSFFLTKALEQYSNGLYLSNSLLFILQPLKVLYIISLLIEIHVRRMGNEQPHSILNTENAEKQHFMLHFCWWALKNASHSLRNSEVH